MLVITDVPMKSGFCFSSSRLDHGIEEPINFLLHFRYKERRWDFKRLIGSGGMPSSHSSTVSALAVAIGLQEGFGASVFAVALILACIVWSPYSFYAYHSDSSCCKFPGTILRKKKNGGR